MSTSIIGGGYLDPSRVAAEIFTPEQFSADDAMMFDTAERFVDEQVWPRLGEIEAKNPDVLPALMQQASELGLTMTDIPEDYDGLGLPLPTSMRVLEKLAREQSFMLSMMVQNGIGSQPVVLFGSEAQRSEWLPAFASGERRGCYCLTEPGSGSDALAARASARLDGDEWVLNGTKQFITNAGFAHVGFVFAQVAEAVDERSGFTCFVVPFDAPGVSTGAEEHKLGIIGSSTRQVILQDARIPRDHVLGEIGRGHVIAFNILNNGRYKLGGAALGSAKYAFNAAIEYALGRRQFGQPVIAFGMIKRKVGQCAADIFAVESAIYRAGGDIQADSEARGGGPEAKLAALQNHALECSIAKLAGSELLWQVADESLQMFGGYGFLEEYPAAKYLRDARISRIYEGTNEINRIVMPRTLLKKLAAGELSLVDAGAPQASGPAAAVAPLKILHARCFEAARARYGDGRGFDADQETMAHLADMEIAIYLAESTLLRVEQAAGEAPPVYRAIADLVLGQSARRVEALCRELALHLDIPLPAADLPVSDALELRQQIADFIIDQEGYRL